MVKTKKIKVFITLSKSDCKKRWIIKQPSSPWIINPEYNTAETSCDIAFDGVDLTIGKNHELVDIAFTLSIDCLNNFTFSKNSTIVSGKVLFLCNGYIQATDWGNQDILYDRKLKVIRWQFDSDRDDQLIKIAKNVILGVNNNYLHSIIVYL